MIDKKTFITALVLILIVIGVSSIYWFTKGSVNKQTNQAANENENLEKTRPGNREGLSNEIVVENIEDNQVITSPLTIEGQAKGTWFSEGEMPFRLVSQGGLVLREGSIFADGNWMTDNFVDFKVEIEFEAENIEKGYIYITQSNPRGLEKELEELCLPVLFK
ncbi:MAG: Gmad2 immunoglobulin-like domain-containing protein [Patescibacteria group bacterium]|nr:Gmad2 immunoglobulin-like domain-containing protein [Patescibacteria group bacterium]